MDFSCSLIILTDSKFRENDKPNVSQFDTNLFQERLHLNDLQFLEETVPLMYPSLNIKAKIQVKQSSLIFEVSIESTKQRIPSSFVLLRIEVTYAHITTSDNSRLSETISRRFCSYHMGFVYFICAIGGMLAFLIFMAPGERILLFNVLNVLITDLVVTLSLSRNAMVLERVQGQLSAHARSLS